MTGRSLVRFLLPLPGLDHSLVRYFATSGTPLIQPVPFFSSRPFIRAGTTTGWAFAYCAAPVLLPVPTAGRKAKKRVKRLFTACRTIGFGLLPPYCAANFAVGVTAATLRRLWFSPFRLLCWTSMSPGPTGTPASDAALRGWRALPVSRDFLSPMPAPAVILTCRLPRAHQPSGSLQHTLPACGRRITAYQTR